MKKMLVCLAVLAVAGGSASAWAAPISYSETYYDFLITMQDDANTTGFFQSSAAPPLGHKTELEEGGIEAQVPDISTMFSAGSVYPYKNTKTIASGWMTVRFTFTATFPQIRISYEYGLNVLVDVGDPPNNGSALVRFSWVISDHHSSWYVDVHRIKSLDGNGKDYEYGSVNVLLDLVPGHEYDIGFFPDFKLTVNKYSKIHTEASYEFWLRNIDIQAVPLPSPIVLLGSGLAALWAWRRFTL